MRIVLSVLGVPSAQKRHRTFTRGKGGKPLPFPRRMDPSAQDKSAFLAQILHKAPPTPLEGPIRLQCSFIFPRPKSHYRTGRYAHALKPTAPHWHISRPDLDNLIKLVKDAMSGVFYRDDSQICSMDADKFYKDEITPCTIILIETLSEDEPCPEDANGSSAANNCAPSDSLECPEANTGTSSTGTSNPIL